MSLFSRFVGKLTADFETRVKRAKVYVDPMIQERLKHLEANINWSDKPVRTRISPTQLSDGADIIWCMNRMICCSGS